MPAIQRHNLFPSLTAAFTLAAALICVDQPAEAQAPNYANGNAADFSPTAYNEKIKIFHEILAVEGTQYVPDDGGTGHPSRYGIMGVNFGLSNNDLWNLGPEGAFRIYETIWEQSGIDNLSNDVRFRTVAFNDLVQFGSGQSTLRMINAADGNADRLMALNAEHYQNICISRASRGLSCSYKHSWDNRQNNLYNFINAPSSFDEIKIMARNSTSPQMQVAVNGQKVTPPAVIQVTQAKNLATPSTHTPHKSPSNGPSILWAIFMVSAVRRRRFDDIKVLPPLDSEADEPIINWPRVRELMNRMTGNTDNSIATEENLAMGPLRAPTTEVKTTHGLSAFEREALWKIFESHHPQPDKMPHTWRVDYPDQSHIIVEPSRLHLHGDGGIEDALKYAAIAWGKECALHGGSPQEREKIRLAAQKLVDSGEIAEGFMISGLGTFVKMPVLTSEDELLPSVPFFSTPREPIGPVPANI